MLQMYARNSLGALLLAALVVENDDALCHGQRTSREKPGQINISNSIVTMGGNSPPVLDITPGLPFEFTVHGRDSAGNFVTRGGAEFRFVVYLVRSNRTGMGGYVPPGMESLAPEGTNWDGVDHPGDNCRYDCDVHRSRWTDDRDSSGRLVQAPEHAVPCGWCGTGFCIRVSRDVAAVYASRTHIPDEDRRSFDYRCGIPPSRTWHDVLVTERNAAQIFDPGLVLCNSVQCGANQSRPHGVVCNGAPGTACRPGEYGRDKGDGSYYFTPYVDTQHFPAETDRAQGDRGPGSLMLWGDYQIDVEGLDERTREWVTILNSPLRGRMHVIDCTLNGTLQGTVVNEDGNQCECLPGWVQLVNQSLVWGKPRHVHCTACPMDTYVGDMAGGRRECVSCPAGLHSNVGTPASMVAGQPSEGCRKLPRWMGPQYGFFEHLRDSPHDPGMNIDVRVLLPVPAVLLLMLLGLAVCAARSLSTWSQQKKNSGVRGERHQLENPTVFQEANPVAAAHRSDAPITPVCAVDDLRARGKTSEFKAPHYPAALGARVHAPEFGAGTYLHFDPMFCCGHHRHTIEFDESGQQVLVSDCWLWRALCPGPIAGFGRMCVPGDDDSDLWSNITDLGSVEISTLMSPEIKTIPLTSDQRDVAMTICELQHQIALRFGVAPGQQQLVVHACAGVTDDNAAKVGTVLEGFQPTDSVFATGVRADMHLMLVAMPLVEGFEDSNLPQALIDVGWPMSVDWPNRVKTLSRLRRERLAAETHRVGPKCLLKSCSWGVVNEGAKCTCVGCLQVFGIPVATWAGCQILSIFIVWLQIGSMVLLLRGGTHTALECSCPSRSESIGHPICDGVDKWVGTEEMQPHQYSNGRSDDKYTDADLVFDVNSCYERARRGECWVTGLNGDLLAWNPVMKESCCGSCKHFTEPHLEYYNVDETFHQSGIAIDRTYHDRNVDRMKYLFNLPLAEQPFFADCREHEDGASMCVAQYRETNCCGMECEHGMPHDTALSDRSGPRGWYAPTGVSNCEFDGCAGWSCSIICDEICSKICGCTTGLIEKLIYALNVIFVVLACVCGPLCGCISVTGCNKDKAAFESALGGQDYDPRPRRRTWGGARRIYRCIGTDGVVIRALPRESVYRAQTEAPIRADVAIDSAVVGNLLLGEAIVAIEGRMLRGSEHGLRGSLCVRCDRGWVSVTTADNPKKNPLLRLVSGPKLRPPANGGVALRVSMDETVEVSAVVPADNDQSSLPATFCYGREHGQLEYIKLADGRGYLPLQTLGHTQWGVFVSGGVGQSFARVDARGEIVQTIPVPIEEEDDDDDDDEEEDIEIAAGERAQMQEEHEEKEETVRTPEGFEDASDEESDNGGDSDEEVPRPPVRWFDEKAQQAGPYIPTIASSSDEEDSDEIDSDDQDSDEGSNRVATAPRTGRNRRPDHMTNVDRIRRGLYVPMIGSSSDEGDSYLDSDDDNDDDDDNDEPVAQNKFTKTRAGRYIPTAASSSDEEDLYEEEEESESAYEEDEDSSFKRGATRGRFSVATESTDSDDDEIDSDEDLV